MRSSIVTRSYGVAVSTPDFESGDPGSIPGKTFLLLRLAFIKLDETIKMMKG
jgi:hypothetical protein